MRNSQDAYGRQLLAQYLSGAQSAEIIERSDRYIDTGSAPGTYFLEYRDWSPLERRAIKLARGKILDIGCGAGRHALYLRQNGFDVTGIDNSPGAIKVCKLRGLKKAFVRNITEVDKFKPESFDTVLMLGNNFGLFGSAQRARRILKKLYRVTTPTARIITATLNPYKTDDPNHLRYHRLNKSRGRMGGQIRMRVRFESAIGDWFDYLFVSPEEMESIVSATAWRIEKFIAAEEPHYFALIRKEQ